ncbi:MAG: carboxypeptidase-like regulatory domain-containing protein [Ilumatobacteraceae bacterium]
MRVDLLTPLVQLRPDQRGTVEFEVRNDGDVIERIVCTIPELDPAWYEVSPVALTLFPDDVGAVRLTLMLPRTFPAGTHDLTVRTTGRVGGEVISRRLVVQVDDYFDMAMSLNPSIVTARRRGRFFVTLLNKGNAPTEMVVRVSDDNAELTMEIDQPVLAVAPGEQRYARVEAKGKRPWFGTPVSHTVVVSAEQLPEVLTSRMTLRLKPRLTAGLITAMMLALIVAVWATALLLSANAAFGTSSPKKAIPDNFAKGVDLASLDPVAVGGSMAGIVTAASNGAPLARITIELYDSHDKFVTAVATGPDGSYTLAGVLPGRYRLRFRGPGFDDRWYPNAVSSAAAQVIQVEPKKKLDGLDLALPGGSGSMTATVVAPDNAPVPVTVTAVAVDTPQPTEQTMQAVAGQPFTFSGLPTPATYRITATAASFQDTEITQALEAGQQVTTNPIALSATAGSITGTVVDSAGNPLGDITISTTVNGKPVSTVTPTVGSIGTFSFTELPTPGTYVFELKGKDVATAVVAVKLEAGQSAPGQTVSMISATGTLTGVVTADGAGLGGATVTVSGGGFTATATTFTANPPGSYTVTGVPVPGTYVVTVSSPGREASSTTVTLGADQPNGTVSTDLLTAVGRIYGTVTLDGAPIGAATIVVSDGDKSLSTVSATVGNVGSYEVRNLGPGIYTVTATFGTGTNAAVGPITRLVTVGVNPEVPGTPITIELRG